MTEKFWTWAREFANKKVREAYMGVVHHDRLCERCGTWTSEVGGCLKLVDDPKDPMFELMTCRKCGHVSRWDCRFMVPMLEIKKEIIVSTNDVPGASSVHNDELAMGCWAEHEDGSLIFVESTENSRVIYSMFDVTSDPITEYRDSMPEQGFKKAFSYTAGTSDIPWTWHDKTPFPWDRIISLGARDGVRHAHADDLISAAEKVARSRKLHDRGFDPDNYSHLGNEKRERPNSSIINKIQRAINELRT